MNNKHAIRTEIDRLLKKADWWGKDRNFSNMTKGLIDDVLRDDSPEMQALSIVAIVQLLHLQTEYVELLRKLKPPQKKNRIERIKRFFKNLFRDRKLEAFQKDISRKENWFPGGVENVCSLVNELHTNIQETKN